MANEDLEGKKVLLKDLLDKKLGKHFFARIEIEDEDLAYEIFETVNAKGVDLNVADLIKNQIFRHVVNGDKKYIDSAKERWLTLTETVDASGLTMKDFLSYYWSSRYGYVADRKLYKTIRDHFRVADDRWDEFLDDLVENALHVKNIFTGTIEDIETQTGDFGEAVKVFESLRVLRNSKAKTWSILYLCLFRNLFISETNKRGTSFELGNRWDILAKFTFVYYEVLNLSGNWYFKEIWNFCKKVEDYVAKKKSKKEFADLFRNDLFTQFDTKLPKSREVFEEGFTSITYKDSKKARVMVRYVLSELELSLAGKFDVGFDETKVSIEHILPQNPNEWGRTKKETKEYVNQIGNLLLISKRKNGALGNKPLADKLVELRDQSTKLRLVDDFLTKAESTEWNFDAISASGDFVAILARGRFLAEIAYKIWVQELRQRMGFS